MSKIDVVVILPMVTPVKSYKLISVLVVELESSLGILFSRRKFQTPQFVQCCFDSVSVLLSLCVTVFGSFLSCLPYLEAILILGGGGDSTYVLALPMRTRQA